VVTASDDRKAIIWDVETGRILRTLEGHTKLVRMARFNCTGDKVVTASDDGKAIIWDVETGSPLHALHADWIYSAAFSPTGNKVVTVSLNETKIWDVETGRLLHTLETGTKFIEVIFNPTGDKMVTQARNRGFTWDGVEETGFELWDVEKGSLIYTEEEECFVETLWWPLCKTEEFLNEKITPQQADTLKTIFKELSTDGIVFDFNAYPHLWKEYESLPEEIKMVFDPYIDKLTI
jgi:WD40 repeat protein